MGTSRFSKAIRKEIEAAKAAGIVWQQRPSVLLHPQIPSPMHGVAPREILGPTWWDATRKQAYASTEYHCLACGVHRDNAKTRKWLEGHECYEINYAMGWMKYVETVPLCHYCHNYIHKGRLQALMEQGRISQGKYVAVIRHGDELLRRYGLTPPLLPREAAPWGQWRMILMGVEYPPIYTSEEEWRRAAKG